MKYPNSGLGAFLAISGSGESTHLPAMWPGFDSRTRRHIYVGLVRLAYKSSLESVKRDRQSPSERARDTSEREPLQLAAGPFNKKRASDFEKV